MSEQATTATEHRIEEGEDFDVEDFAEVAAQDTIELPDSLRLWFPTEYVEAIFGPRGSGKDILMVRHLMIALGKGYPVFTNAILYPEKLGIENRPHPLDLKFLLTFDSSMTGGVIGISEINTWVKKKRAMATTNLVVGDFLTQLRKRGLRVFMTTQFDYLPGEVADQVDLTVHAQDLFFTEYGKEAKLAKGTAFQYVYTDKSGIFTGQKGSQWMWGLRHANKLWPLYETEQIYDPLEWARRTRVVAEETIIDLDSGESYTAGEREIRTQQRAIEGYDVLLAAVYRSWGNSFVKFAQENGAIIEDAPSMYRLSVAKLGTALTRLKGTKRKQLEQDYERLRTLAGSGTVARFRQEHKIIELAKPITEASYEE